jgi:hypothetical protein
MDRTAPRFQATSNAIPAMLHALAMPFRAVSAFWSDVLNASVRAEAAQRLCATSDAELAARGLTRQIEIERIFNSPADRVLRF